MSHETITPLSHQSLIPNSSSNNNIRGNRASSNSLYNENVRIGSDDFEFGSLPGSQSEMNLLSIEAKAISDAPPPLERNNTFSTTTLIIKFPPKFPVKGYPTFKLYSFPGVSVK